MRWNLMLLVRSFLQSLLLIARTKIDLCATKGYQKEGFENAYRIMMRPQRYYYYFNQRSRKRT